MDTSTIVGYFKIEHLKPILDGISVIWLEISVFSILAIVPYTPTWLVDSCNALATTACLFLSTHITRLGLVPLMLTLRPYYTTIASSPALNLLANLLYYIPSVAFHIVYLSFLIQAAMMIYYPLSGLCIITYQSLLASATTSNDSSGTTTINNNYKSNHHLSISAFIISKTVGIRDFDADDDTAEKPSEPDVSSAQLRLQREAQSIAARSEDRESTNEVSSSLDLLFASFPHADVMT